MLEAGNAVVGIAAAKRPDPVADSGHDPARARFIESVWIEASRRPGSSSRIRVMSKVRGDSTSRVGCRLLGTGLDVEA
ncbi:MAG TPA: hypothetical protein VK586_22235 [Streptosporangiaceae bacterium]|nr:hypothetical protein [Streptosporangiaceae bacterium]